MNRPNALSPFLMSPTERRAELCRILALGLIRLMQRHHGDTGQQSDETGESSLHHPPDRSGHATPMQRRPA
jgi:hypothetical protein